jgi:acetyl esterase/lipase
MISPEPKIAYGASKAGMNHLAKELSVIAGAAGVRVNVLAPGNINFPDGRWEEILSGPKAEERRTVVLYLHGGGFVIGSSGSHRHMGSGIALRTGGATAVLDYRLAPEHPFSGGGR